MEYLRSIMESAMSTVTKQALTHEYRVEAIQLVLLGHHGHR